MFVVQAHEALGSETLAPLADRLATGANPLGHRLVVQAIGANNFEVIIAADKITELVDRYIERGTHKGMRADVQHIAAATVSGVDVLASWNFCHMVSLGESSSVV